MSGRNHRPSAADLIHCVNMPNFLAAWLWPIVGRHEPPFDVFLDPLPGLAIGAGRGLILKSRKVETGLRLGRPVTAHAVLGQNGQHGSAKGDLPGRSLGSPACLSKTPGHGVMPPEPRSMNPDRMEIRSRLTFARTISSKCGRSGACIQSILRGMCPGVDPCCRIWPDGFIQPAKGLWGPSRVCPLVRLTHFSTPPRLVPRCRPDTASRPERLFPR